MALILVLGLMVAYEFCGMTFYLTEDFSEQQRDFTNIMMNSDDYYVRIDVSKNDLGVTTAEEMAKFVAEYNAEWYDSVEVGCTNGVYYVTYTDYGTVQEVYGFYG